MAYESMARQIALEYGLDPDLFVNQITIESGWNPKAVSPKGAMGLGQLMPGTAKELGVSDPFDPEQNLRGAATYMKKMLDANDGNYRKALASYIQGPAGSKGKWVDETHDYIAKILPPEMNLAEATKQLGRPMDIKGFREQFPMYKDKSDEELAKNLHERFAPEMEYGQFRKKFGVEPGTWETLKNIPSMMASGMREPLGQLAQTAPVLTRAQEYETIKQGGQIPEGVSPTVMPSGSVMSKMAVPFGAVQLPGARSQQEVVAAKESVQSPLEQHPLWRLGESISGQPNVPSDIQQTYTSQVAKQIGRLPTQVGLFALNPGLALGQSMGGEAVEMYKRGMAQGVGEEVATKAASEAMELGVLDYAGLLLPAGALKTIVGKSTSSAFSRFVQKFPISTTTVGGTIGEMATEFLQTHGENKLARKYFNEAVNEYESQKQTGIVTGASSLITYGLLSAIGVRLRGGIKPEEAADVKLPTPPAEVQSGDVDLAVKSQESVTQLELDLAKAKRDWDLTGDDKFLDRAKQIQSEIGLEEDFQRQVERVQPTDVIGAQKRRAAESIINDPELAAQFQASLAKVNPPPQVQSPFTVREFSRTEPIESSQPMAQAPTPPQLGVSPVERELPGLSQRILRQQEAKRVAQAELESRIGQKIYRSQAGMKTAIEYFRDKHGLVLGPVIQPDGTYRLSKIQQVESVSPPKVLDVMKEPEVVVEEKTPEIAEKVAPEVITREDGSQVKQKDIDIPMVDAQRAELEIMKARKAKSEEIKARRVEQARLVNETNRKTFKDYGEARDWLDKHEGMISGEIDGSGKKIVNVRPVESEDVESYQKGPEINFYSFDPFQMIKPMWFSQMNVAIQNDIVNWPKKIAGSEAINRIKKLASLGRFKKEELEDVLRLTGLKKKIDSWEGKIPREKVAEWVEDYQIRVEEVKYDKDKTKHNQYTLPGGESYVELILTSPQAEELDKDSDHFAVGKGLKQIGWIRGQEFRDSNGQRVFFIEEMQSKRHQEGRDEGYSEEVPERIHKGRFGEFIEPAYKTEGVPDAPFRQSNMRLMARRAIRWAAERGIKTIAWATGEQQAERWPTVPIESWPQKIYGTEGNYHKSVIGIAMKEAVKPHSVKEVMVSNADPSIGNNPAIELSEEALQSFANEPMMLYSFDPFYMTKSNSNILRKSITEGLQGDKITTAWTNDTFGWLDKYVVQPWWGAKDNPRLEPIVRAAHGIGQRFNEWFSQSIEVLKGLEKLTKVERALMWDTMWATEGKPIAGMEPSAILIDQNNKASLNESWYGDYNNWARTKVPENIAEQMVEIRRSLDQDHVNRWNLAVSSGVDNKILEELKDNTYGIPNYLPHSRYGDYVIEGYDKDGKKIVDHATDLSIILDNLPYLKDRVNKRRYESQIAPRLIAKLKEDPMIKDLGVAEWKLTKRLEKDTREVENNAMLYLALNNVLENAANQMRASGMEEMADGLEKALPKAIADELKKRGTWGHMAKRKGIQGFEKVAMERVLYDYKMGQYAGLSKMVGAQEFAELARGLDKKRGNEYDFATRYIRDMLEPRSGIDKLVSGFRGLAGLHYLGGNVKTALLNLGTFWLQGGSRLAVDVGPSADKFIAKATAKTTKQLINGKAFSPWQARLHQELIKDGTIQNQMITEIRSKVARSAGAEAIIGKIFDVTMAPLAFTERMSRTITALAAADAARNGRVISEKHGLAGVSLDPNNESAYQAIKSYAEEVVLDSHGLYGKANRPSFARTGRLGKLVGASYTFRNFQQNVLHMYSKMARQGLAGNKNAAYGLARAIMGNILIAGVGFGLPLAATLRLMYRELLPKEWKVLDEDPLLWARRQMPDEWKNLMTYGISGAFGQVGVGSSYSMEAPENFEDLLGIPVTMAKDVQRAGKALSVGDYEKMAEILIPVKIVRSVIQANRLREEGMTTMGGQPINVYGEEESMKLGFGEAVMKGLGFQPIRMQGAWDYQEALSNVEETVSSKQSNLADRYTVAMNNGDMDEVDRVLAELDDWNTFWAERDKIEYMIDINESIRRRMSPRQPRRRSAQAALELVEEIMQ